MTRIGDIKLSVDEFLTNTRVRICCNFQCKYLSEDALSCTFKTIRIEKDGKCGEFEKKNENKEQKSCEHCGEPLDKHGSCPNEDEVAFELCDNFGLRCSYEECDCPGCITIQ